MLAARVDLSLICSLQGYVQSAGVTAWIIMTVALFMACPTPLMEPLLHQNQ